MFRRHLELTNHELLKKLPHLSENYSDVVTLVSNEVPSGAYNSYDSLLAFGAKQKKVVFKPSEIESLFDEIEQSENWWLGAFSYEIKNCFEDLISNNASFHNAPLAAFISPKVLVKTSENKVEIEAQDEADLKAFITLLNEEDVSTGVIDVSEIKNRTTKSQYIKNVKSIQKHISRGDIYELNYCVEYYAEKANIAPEKLFLDLIKVSPNPLSGLVKIDNHYLLSASPERFLKKENNKLTAQPIKGTAPRGLNEAEDTIIKNALSSNLKEQTENVMIVDLVRNDLSRIAKTGTVKVEELFGMYTFPQVHQMISTVVCNLKSNVSNFEIFKSNFPMGSMTGAPKIKAMKLIDDFEDFERGWFSGSIGYFKPGGDFDFNVVIRSILFNAKNNYLSFPVGSAITKHADPEKEFEECKLKIKAILELLNND